MSKRKPYKWSFQKLQEEALKFSTRGNFQKGSPSAYQMARRKGKEFLDSICIHMPPPLTEAYSLSELMAEAKLYQKRNDFEKGSPSIYVVSKRRPDYEKIVAHMDPPLTVAYSLEEIQQDAQKYVEYGDFKKNSPNIYSSASKRGILQEVCSHMKHSKTTSIAEKEIFDTVKLFYFSAKKLIDKRVKIENKPHIQGFHVDIFVPELNKGIEFDGKYHHSFEGLKRRKPNWSDEDIRNYHQLKDDWFTSKGIKILHIKEEDWNKDKKVCVKICLEFLEIYL